MKTDYRSVIVQALRECRSMLEDREELDLRLAQKEQFIRAAMTQLPDDARKEFETDWDNLTTRLSGLSACIRSVLSTAPRKWLTATEVRDALVKTGFNFENYSSNPLASVHSALKRLKPDEVELNKIDGVMAWRWKNATITPRISHHRQTSIMSASGTVSTALTNLINIWSDFVPLEDGEKER